MSGFCDRKLIGNTGHSFDELISVHDMLFLIILGICLCWLYVCVTPTYYNKH